MRGIGVAKFDASQTNVFLGFSLRRGGVANFVVIQNNALLGFILFRKGGVTNFDVINNNSLPVLKRRSIDVIKIMLSKDSYC